MILQAPEVSQEQTEKLEDPKGLFLVCVWCRECVIIRVEVGDQGQGVIVRSKVEDGARGPTQRPNDGEQMCTHVQLYCSALGMSHSCQLFPLTCSAIY